MSVYFQTKIKFKKGVKYKANMKTKCTLFYQNLTMEENRNKNIIAVFTVYVILLCNSEGSLKKHCYSLHNRNSK